MSHYAMERGWQEHPLFEGDEYSRRDAWEWLIANAHWCETKRRIRGKIITLKRGQLSHSVRFLADKWKWPQTNVHRFLQSLKDETMIGTETEQDQNVITILNYEKYQKPIKATRNEKGTKTGTELEQSWNKEEEGKEGKEKIDDDCNAREVSPDQVQEIYSWCETEFNSPTPLITAPIVAWLGWGASFELDIKPVVKRYLASGKKPLRSLKWLDEDIARSIEQRKAPMPEVTGPDPPNGKFLTFEQREMQDFQERMARKRKALAEKEGAAIQ